MQNVVVSTLLALKIVAVAIYAISRPSSVLHIPFKPLNQRLKSF